MMGRAVPSYYVLVLFILVQLPCSINMASQNGCTLPGDINHDCKVDINDLALFAAGWLDSGNSAANIDNINLPDFHDFSLLANNWNHSYTSIYTVGTTWYLENACLLMTIIPSTGYISVFDKQAGYTWTQPGNRQHYAFTNITQAASDQVTFQTTSKLDAGTTNSKIRIVLPANSRQFQLYTDTVNPGTTFTTLENLEPFSAPNTNNSYLAVADWSCGHIYPTNMISWPATSTWIENYFVDLLQLPWVGVVDIVSGQGYSVTVDTPYDATVSCIFLGSRRAPLMYWRSQKNVMGYERCLIYDFTVSGGYVSLAKDLRSYMQAKGYLTTFSQKAVSRPDVTKLFGAPRLWDYFHYIKASEASTAGVLKATHFVCKWDSSYNKYSSDAPAITAQNALGWLTQEYQCYADAYPCDMSHPAPEPLYDIYPTNFMKDSSGNVILGWNDINGQQYMRCPAFYVQRAAEYLPSRLATYPMNSLYLDVTPVRNGTECYDVSHPKTRSQYLSDGVGLMSYISNHPLVLSGETGKWFSVPYLDAPLGLMSVLWNPWNNQTAVPIDCYHDLDINNDGTNDTTLEAWDTYETWGSLGHANRIPLWQLVFHDCSSTDWSPGDAIDYTAHAEKNNSPPWPFSYQLKKEVLSILYGSVPTFVMIGDGFPGAWTENRLAFMRTYRNVCKLHEVIGNQELVSHQFLTANRNVQQTTWADGTIVRANFGSSDYLTNLGGKSYTLKQFGWCAYGPSYVGSCSYNATLGKIVTEINQPGLYYFTDSSGVPVAEHKIDSATLRVNGDNVGGSNNIRIYPKRVITSWNMVGTTLYLCNTISGARTSATVSYTIGTDSNGEQYIETTPRTGLVVLDAVTIP